MNFRADRFASLHIASPLIRVGWNRQRKVPILMYHSVGKEEQLARGPYYRTSVSPESFSLQMNFLHLRGYRTCTLTEAIACLDKPTSGTDDKVVVITFDDGFADFYTGAFPILHRFGLTATMFLPTGYIADSPMAFKDHNCMTWSQIRELQKCGIEFGSHTVTHPQLRTLDRPAIERELTESKKAIEDRTGCAAESFAYPYAFPQVDTGFRRLLRECLESAGYVNGVCTIVGRANTSSDRFFLERLPLNDLDDERLLEAKLCGAYDWVGSVQSFVKGVRSLPAKCFGN
jgi:peptidoglycan/xylan/chitin deacetylase (PgdA/CDA1 family)